MFESFDRFACLPPAYRQTGQAGLLGVGYIHFQQFQQLEHITQCEALAGCPDFPLYSF